MIHSAAIPLSSRALHSPWADLAKGTLAYRQLRPDGPKAHDALAIQPDHKMSASQSRPRPSQDHGGHGPLKGPLPAGVSARPVWPFVTLRPGRLPLLGLPHRSLEAMRNRGVTDGNFSRRSSMAVRVRETKIYGRKPLGRPPIIAKCGQSDSSDHHRAPPLFLYLWG